MAGLISEIIARLGGGAAGALGQALAGEASVQEMEDAAQEALQETLYSAEGLNLGQQELIDGYVGPAMESAISSDPEDFTADDLVSEAFSAHYAAEQALSTTITNAASKAAKARDQVKRAAQLDAAAAGEGADE
jgi:hypothetical protein